VLRDGANNVSAKPSREKDLRTGEQHRQRQQAKAAALRHRRNPDISPFSAVECNCPLKRPLNYMETEFEKLEADALKLTPGERAVLAQRLLASLEEDAEIEEAWAVEVERRIAEVEIGAVQLIPIGEALARVRAAL